MTELQNTPETATQPGTAATDTSSLEAFKELLSGGTPNEGDAGGSQQNAQPAGESEGGPKGKPKKFNELAERLGVELDDLYKLEIAAAEDGSPVTVETLKDAWAKQGDLSVRELQLAELKAKHEAEITRERSDLEALIKLIDPKAITPQFVEEVKRRAADESKRELDATLGVIPEWQDAAVRDKELAGMVDYLKDYGISPGFLGAMPNHRLFKFVRDAWQRKVRVDAALAKITPVKGATTAGKSKPTGAAPRKPNTSPTPVSSGDMKSRFAAILQSEGN